MVEKNERALVAQYNVGEWNLVDPSKREGGLEVDVKGGIRTPLNQQHREIRQKKEKKNKDDSILITSPVQSRKRTRIVCKNKENSYTAAIDLKLWSCSLANSQSKDCWVSSQFSWYIIFLRSYYY